MWPFKSRKKNPRYICPMCLDEMTGDEQVDRKEHKACIERYLTLETFGPHSYLW